MLLLVIGLACLLLAIFFTHSAWKSSGYYVQYFGTREAESLRHCLFASYVIEIILVALFTILILEKAFP